MISKVFSATLVGLEAQLIDVEVDLTFGLHSFNIVGLADKAVDEARQRVSSAIKNTGMLPPSKSNQKVIVNLAPADFKKEGSAFDLAIAASYLLASEQISFNPKKKLFLGELALDGQVRAVSGILPAVIRAKNAGIEDVFVPQPNVFEAALVPAINVFGVEKLQDVVDHLEHRKVVAPAPLTRPEGIARDDSFEILPHQIRGQENAKYAMEIAAAGGHNVLMIGPPGAGKTILAKSLRAILPPMSFEEMTEVTSIFSAAGKLSDKPIVTQRPFRGPHHTISEAALIGGGTPPRPGEITLAHRGVLFMDEFPEFHRDLIESLRQPLEEGKIQIGRSRYALTFPARFIFIAAQNPCPCGNWQNPQTPCSCNFVQINKYQKRVSGPIGDRIDIHLSVPAVPPEELLGPRGEDSSRTDLMIGQIKKARAVQQERLAKDGLLTNSEMGLKQIEKHCAVSPAHKDILLGYLKKHALSARGYHRVLKLARTIADLEESPEIKLEHLGQAVKYRTMET